MDSNELKEFLDYKVKQYNSWTFIESDPISIPHGFSQKEDIEIAGFLVATISWGNRKSIVKSGERMLELMGNSPYDFVMSYKLNQLKRLDDFVHRTFNASDLKYFIGALRRIYSLHGGIEAIFSKHATKDSLQPAIHEFKKLFFTAPHPERMSKHIADPFKNSAAKKINM